MMEVNAACLALFVNRTACEREYDEDEIIRILDGSSVGWRSCVESAAEPTPIPTHIQTPIYTLHQTIFPTLHKSPINTIHQSPIQTIQQTPYNTLQQTLHATLQHTACPTLYNTLQQTPYNTIHPTLFPTLHQSPIQTPIPTPMPTPTPDYVVISLSSDVNNYGYSDKVVGYDSVNNYVMYHGERTDLRYNYTYSIVNGFRNSDEFNDTFTARKYGATISLTPNNSSVLSWFNITLTDQYGAEYDWVGDVGVFDVVLSGGEVCEEGVYSTVNGVTKYSPGPCHRAIDSVDVYMPIEDASIIDTNISPFGACFPSTNHSDDITLTTTISNTKTHNRIIFHGENMPSGIRSAGFATYNEDSGAYESIDGDAYITFSCSGSDSICEGYRALVSSTNKIRYAIECNSSNVCVCLGDSEDDRSYVLYFGGEYDEWYRMQQQIPDATPIPTIQPTPIQTPYPTPSPSPSCPPRPEADCSGGYDNIIIHIPVDRRVDENGDMHYEHTYDPYVQITTCSLSKTKWIGYIPYDEDMINEFEVFKSGERRVKIIIRNTILNDGIDVRSLQLGYGTKMNISVWCDDGIYQHTNIDIYGYQMTSGWMSGMYDFIGTIYNPLECEPDLFSEPDSYSGDIIIAGKKSTDVEGKVDTIVLASDEYETSEYGVEHVPMHVAGNASIGYGDDIAASVLWDYFISDRTVYKLKYVGGEIDDDSEHEFIWVDNANHYYKGCLYTYSTSTEDIFVSVYINRDVMPLEYSYSNIYLSIIESYTGTFRFYVRFDRTNIVL